MWFDGNFRLLALIVAALSHDFHDPIDEVMYLRPVILNVLVFHEIAVEVVVELPCNGKVGVQ